MHTDQTAASLAPTWTSSRRFVPARFAIRVGQDWSPMRAVAVWPIADALGVEPGLQPAIPTPALSSGDDVGLVLDLIDSGMIAPPRPRRRRERVVSSRAVFYQASEA